MKTTLSILIIAALFTGCNFIKSLTSDSTGGSNTSVSANEYDLQVTPDQTEVTLEWGKTTEIPLDVKWGGAQKYPVQINPAANTPAWLMVETKPAILQPPGKAVLNLTATLGEAELGSRTLVIEASAYGMTTPKQVEIKLHIQRQAGKFVPVLSAPVSVECRSICGKVANGRVTFYDVLREKNQSCSDKADLPESQKIGIMSYPVSSSGYGFGRTCQVAAVFTTDGALNVVNLGLPGAAKKRGEVLLKVPSAQICWLSQDNTVALVTTAGSLSPYDVRTGLPLGLGCSIYGSDLTDATLDGMHLSAIASKTCEWEIK
jgi:hypothetical protein